MTRNFTYILWSIRDISLFFTFLFVIAYSILYKKHVSFTYFHDMEYILASVGLTIYLAYSSNKNNYKKFPLLLKFEKLSVWSRNIFNFQVMLCVGFILIILIYKFNKYINDNI